jgi:hypothetical protein
MLLNDRIQDPLVGLACQQLVRDGSMYYSPVPVHQVFIVPTILSRYSKVPRAIPTSASVLCNVNILYRLIGDIKLTYFIVEQKTTLRLAAVFRYQHLLSRLSRFHCRGREYELFCLVQAMRGLRETQQPIAAAKHFPALVWRQGGKRNNIPILINASLSQPNYQQEMIINIILSASAYCANS